MFTTSNTTLDIFKSIQNVSLSLGAMIRNKEANVGKYGYQYVDLNTLLAELKPILEAQELNFFSVPTGRGSLLYRLTCLKTGEFVQSVYEYPVDIKNPQDQGAVITYMTRYGLMSMFNIEAYIDNDGVTSTSSSKTLPSLKPSTKEWAEVTAKIKAGTLSLEQVLDQYTVAGTVKTLLLRYAEQAGK